jgi:hypothetical protein
MTIGRRLGVRYVLSGSAACRDSRLRVAVTLTDTVEARDVWAEIFERPTDDVFLVEDQISDLVSDAVEFEIELKERQRALLIPIASLDAWSAYHRAVNHMFRFRAKDFDEAERYLKLATGLDPSSSRIFAGLSFVEWQRALLEIVPDRAGALSKAFDYAKKSISLDPRDPQGHWVLGSRASA